MMRKTLIALTAAGALGVGSAALAAGGHGHSAGGGCGGGGSAVGMSRGSVGLSGPMTTGKSVGGPGWGSPTMRTTNIGKGPGRGATNFKSTNLKKGPGWGATNFKSTNLKSTNLKSTNLKNVQLTGHKKSVIIFRNHHHRRVFVDLAFFGVFADFPSCWQWTWTPWGWQRVFVCDVPPWAWG